MNQENNFINLHLKGLLHGLYRLSVTPMASHFFNYLIFYFISITKILHHNKKKITVSG